LVLGCGDDGSDGESAATASAASGGATSASSSTGGATGGGAAAGTGGGGEAGGSGGGGGRPRESCPLGTSWQLADDYHEPEGAAAVDIASDAAGNLYAIGSAPAGTVVRTSSDAGATWQAAGSFPESIRNLAVDSTGRLFAGCNGLGAPMHRVVRRSDDGGQTWTIADDFFVEQASPCWGGFVATAPDDTVYSSGWCFSSAGAKWVVRKSADAGASWSTVLDLPAPNSSALVPIAVDADGNVFVGGTLGGWHVQRGTAVGEWMGVDTFSLSGTDGGLGVLHATTRPYAVVVSSDGNVPHVVVRRGVPGGETWSTLDTLPAPIATLLMGSGGVYEDGLDSILVTSHVPDATNVPHAISRRSSDDGATWVTADDYVYAPGHPTRAGRLTSDPKGNVYAAHTAEDAQGSSHWIVRKLACD
jgi:hypothetical protein